MRAGWKIAPSRSRSMQYNLLFLFVGLGIDDPIWVPTVLTKNRDQLLTTEPDAGMPPDEDGASGDPPVTRPADAPSSPTRDQPDDRPAQRNHNARGRLPGARNARTAHMLRPPTLARGR